MPQITEDIVGMVAEEAKKNPYKNDTLSILFNRMGLVKFRNMLPKNYDPHKPPLFSIPLASAKYSVLLNQVPNLFPYTKGLILKLIAPQKRRKLVGFLNSQILSFIKRYEIESVENIIHELTANAEKANLEFIVKKYGFLDSGLPLKDILVKERETLLELADKENKWTKITWKFTHMVYKVEVRNNTPITAYGISSIKSKMRQNLTSLADGFIGEIDEKLGAGLGLFFVNFFKEEMKNQHGFDTVFRIYETDIGETVVTLTVFFEKDGL